MDAAARSELLSSEMFALLSIYSSGEIGDESHVG
jgi:hypothetical protein